jgi:hypothetical protein
MTKSPHKLTLRKETLRALNTIHLARVIVGGGGAAEAAAGPTAAPVNCPLQSDIAPNK